MSHGSLPRRAGARSLNAPCMDSYVSPRYEGTATVSPTPLSPVSVQARTKALRDSV